MPENSGLLQIEMTNEETSEGMGISFLPFFSDMEMSAVVMVKKVSIFEYRNANSEGEIYSVECKALDSIGRVFSLALIFITETEEQTRQIKSDMKKGAIFLVKGQYNLSQIAVFNLNDPEYSRLPTEIDEGDIREAFRNSSRSRSKSLSKHCLISN